MPAKIGDLISGKYRLIRVIGDGGMGTVFESRHEYLGTKVALKFLHSELAERQGLLARFLREARLAASIRSPYIAHVTDVDQTGDGVAYLVMELLEGQSLSAILEREGKLPQDRALDYTLQILAGLEAAHTIGVVHRDLKPDNVFVVGTPHGPLVKLLDFGIAKLRDPKELQGLTRPGAMMGTPEYMAPEQAYSADTVDARADVYAVGTMLYEMLVGRRPATGDNPQQIAAVVIAGQVPQLQKVDPTVPEGLSRVVHRAMSPMVGDRFPSVAELRQALLPFCRSLSVAGRFAATPPAGGVAPTVPPNGPPGSAAKTEPGTPEPAQWAPGAPEPAQWAPGFLPPAANRPPAAPVHNPAPAQAAPPAAPSYAVPTPAGRYSDEARPAARSRGGRRGSVWLLVGTIGLAVVVVAIVLVTAQTSSEDAQSSATAPPTTTSAVSAAPPAGGPAMNAPPGAAPGTPRVVIAPPVQPAIVPAAPHPPAAKPRAADAGPVEAGSPAPAPGLPPLPFPFPSVLPLPIPSGISIPSSFPIPSTFPPLGLPGFPQPASPAPSSSH